MAVTEAIGDATQIPAGDGAFAEADGLHLAIVIDLSDGAVGIGGVFNPVRDILCVAVGEVSENVELLSCAGSGDEMFWKDFDSLDARFVFPRTRCAGSDPFGENLVIDGIDFETFAAFVRNGAPLA